MPTQATNKKPFLNSPRYLDLSYLHILQEIDFQPIFIMGDHRSGTTLLYKLLAATAAFNFVTSYHIVKYDELLFNRLKEVDLQAKKDLDNFFESIGLTNRIIDNVAISSELPEEYGFILANAEQKNYLCRENITFFTEICKKIQFIGDPLKKLLLKNPWDFTKFIYIKSALPKAKFIFIHRQPIHIINSQLKASISILKERNLYISTISRQYAKSHDNNLYIFYLRLRQSLFSNRALYRTTKGVASGLNYFINNIHLLPSTDYVCVRYEDLCQNTEKVVLEILSFLGVEANSSLSSDTFMESRPLNLLPEVARNYDALYQELQPYFDYFGYEANLGQ